MADPSNTELSHLEQLITSMVDLFEEYAGQEGKKNQISKDELKRLIEKEVSNPLFQKKIPSEDLSKAMDFMDKNHDEMVNFNEFSKCVASLAKGYYKHKTKAAKMAKDNEED